MTPYLDALRIVAWSTSPIAIALNAFLLFVVRLKADKNSGVNLISQSISIACSMFALAEMVYVPSWQFASPGIFVFVSASPLSASFDLMKACHYSWVIAIITDLVFVLVSFPYRCSLIIRPRLGELIEHYRLIHITTIAYVGALFGFVIILFDSPDTMRPALKKALAPFNQHFNFDVDFFFGIGQDYLNAKILVISAGGILVLLAIAFGIAFWSGYLIHSKIKSHKSSPATKRAHGKTLRLLVAQIASPAICIFIPASFVLFHTMGVIILGDDSNVVVLPFHFSQSTVALQNVVLTKGIIFPFTLFPLVNPLVIIAYTDSFRRFALRQQGSTIVAKGTLAIPSAGRIRSSAANVN